jgi:acetyl-CoA carboxylase biotin carboxyl carrier protein
MDVEKVKELIELMKANDLNELEIVDGQTRVALKRGGDQAVTQMVSMPSMVPAAAPPESATPAGAAAPEQGTADDDNLIEIPAPLVGTFYSAPSPDAEAYVSVGSQVSEDTVVCILEAMKVMNEIKAEVSGTIKKVLMKNGEAVEFGQAIFLVEPN